MVIGNRVAVRVNVTLADEETPYAPIRGLTLRFTRPSADTVTGRTDEAGVVTVLLPAGNYTVSVPSPYLWKGTYYTWTVPIAVKADMHAIELNRVNAKVDRSGSRVATAAPQRVQSAGEVGGASRATAPSGSTGVSADAGTIRWLSMEVGGEGGLTRSNEGGNSDPGYGGSGAFVGGLGPVALAVGYRYTRIRFGDDLESGSMRGGTAELRYHLRPGAAPIRPYVGALGALGKWYGSETLGEDDGSTMRMFGGTVGAQFGLATSVRLHVAAIVAATNIKTGIVGRNNNGLFATGNIGLTFDIFSPAR
ncbi:MAG TPA: hypothetical protein VJP86_10255 [Vicinamibacterales bacterium]|nr:hypothetical protein [Vicinamibacterales bacterium]